jgi:hypothetical protein
MQILKCSVNLSGQMTHNIQKGVRGRWKEKDTGELKDDFATPAEIIVLRALHGADSVPADKIEVKGSEKRVHTMERDRLRGIYGAKVVDQCFPGYNIQLPETIEEIAAQPVPTVILDNEIGSGTMLND